jgi:glutaredoxin
MRGFLLRLVTMALCLSVAAPTLAAAAPDGGPVEVAAGSTAATIEVYTREGCPHCAAAEVFLESLAATRPGVELLVRDVGRDPAAREQMQQRARAAGVEALGVPLIVVNGRVLVGYGGEDTTGGQIVALLDAARPVIAATGAPDGVCAATPTDPTCLPAAPGAPIGEVELPLVGRVRAGELGLPLFTIIVGLLDGFNPCAMWVLLFLLSVLASLRDRRRMALIGGIFVVISGAAYYAFMAAWLNVFLLIGLSRAVQIVLGVVALVIGAVNLKDFFGLHRGPSLSIPEAVKPGIYRRVRSIIQAGRTVDAVAGAAVLALLVNIVELGCTAGLPAIYTQVLTANHLSGGGYYGYLLLYIAAYMFDDSLMVLIAIVTLSRTKLQERGGRILKLISGLVITVLGIALLARPQWLMW